MAQRDQFNLTQYERKRRTFSPAFKQNKVREIESGLSRVSEVSKQYGVSPTAIYYWLRKFGKDASSPERLIIETMSETRALKELKERVAELERLVGQKQIEVEFYKKMIDLAQDHYGIEIKKNFSTPRSGTSGSNEKKSPSA